MTRCGVARLLAFAMTVLVAGAAVSAGDDEARVLVAVTARSSPLAAITTDELRLAFLAVPVRSGARTLKPVLNRSDPLLYEAFLQKVIFLSSHHYQRQLVSHVFQSGGSRPANVESPKELVGLLQEDGRRVSFMWKRDAERHDELKIVRVLWKGTVR